MPNKINSLYLVTISVLVIISCKPRAFDPSIENFTFTEVPERRREIKLSEIAEDIHYVPLEKHQDALIGSRNAQVIPTDKYLFVSQSDRPLLMFDYKGKYLRTFGKFGRGPNEYGLNYSFSHDISSERIFILNKQSGKIQVFNLDGKDLEPIYPEKKIIQFEYIGNDLFIGCVQTDNYINPKDTNYIIFDSHGRIYNGLHIPGTTIFNYKQNEAVQITPTFYHSPNGVNIITNQNDSIFTATAKGEILISLICNFGKFSAPFNISDPSIDRKEKEKFIRSFGTIETEKFWFIGFNLSNKFHRYILDRSNNQSYVSDLIINDIDGGPNFWPYYRNHKAKKFAILQDILYLKQNKDAGKFNNTDIEYPKRNEEFKVLLDSLSLTDNPIVIVVDLK